MALGSRTVEDRGDGRARRGRSRRRSIDAQISSDNRVTANSVSSSSSSKQGPRAAGATRVTSETSSSMLEGS